MGMLSLQQGILLGLSSTRWTQVQGTILLGLVQVAACWRGSPTCSQAALHRQAQDHAPSAYMLSTLKLTAQKAANEPQLCW